MKQMEISKRLLGGLVGILIGCTSPISPPVTTDPSITVTYAGEFYVLMIKEDEGNYQSYLYQGEKNKIWTEEDLKPIIGKLTNLEVRGIKILGTAYPDYGNLTVTVNDDNKVVAEETAPKGTQRVIVNYSF